MKIIKVDSSAVLKVGYDGVNLLVQYVGGDWYKYHNVSAVVFERLCNADSAGEFINKEVKPKYKDVERLLINPEL